MVVELGRLVFDVEVKEVKNGKKVLNNRLAIRANAKETVFIDIVAWDQVAELMAKYFSKGNEVLIQGELRNDTKEKDGVKYQSVFLLVDKLKFTSGNPKGFEFDFGDDEMDKDIL
jgi:single-strand DNA-binding protein